MQFHRKFEVKQIIPGLTMRDGDHTHSREVRFSPFELDLSTEELEKHGLRIGLQKQPLGILIALLAKPGKIVSREELRQVIWPGNVFLDYGHGLNRSMNKLPRALADTAGEPRYIETVRGRGYRYIAPIEDATSPRGNRLAVLPLENITGVPENDYLADKITEAMIDEVGRVVRPRLRVIALAPVLRYKNKRIRVIKMAAELRAGYLVCGRLRNEEGQYRLRDELVDAHDRTLRWTESFQFAHDTPGRLQRKICNHIADSMDLDLQPSEGLALVSAGA